MAKETDLLRVTELSATDKVRVIKDGASRNMDAGDFQKMITGAVLENPDFASGSRLKHLFVTDDAALDAAALPDLVIVDCGPLNKPITLTMPSTADMANGTDGGAVQGVSIKRVDGLDHALTIKPQVGETIEGEAELVLRKQEGAGFVTVADRPGDWVRLEKSLPSYMTEYDETPGLNRTYREVTQDTVALDTDEMIVASVGATDLTITLPTIATSQRYSAGRLKPLIIRRRDSQNGKKLTLRTSGGDSFASGINSDSFEIPAFGVFIAYPMPEVHSTSWYLEQANMSGSTLRPINVDASRTLNNADDFIVIDAGSNDVTLTLPALDNLPEAGGEDEFGVRFAKRYTLKRLDGQNTRAIVKCATGDTLDSWWPLGDADTDSTQYALAPYETLELIPIKESGAKRWMVLRNAANALDNQVSQYHAAGRRHAVRYITASDTLEEWDDLLTVGAGNGDVVLTLPQISGIAPKMARVDGAYQPAKVFVIKRIDGATQHKVELQTTGGDTIENSDDSNTIDLAAYETVELVADSTADRWVITGGTGKPKRLQYETTNATIDGRTTFYACDIDAGDRTVTLPKISEYAGRTSWFNPTRLGEPLRIVTTNIDGSGGNFKLAAQSGDHINAPSGTGAVSTWTVGNASVHRFVIELIADERANRWLVSSFTELQDTTAP